MHINIQASIRTSRHAHSVAAENMFFTEGTVPTDELDQYINASYTVDVEGGEVAHNDVGSIALDNRTMSVEESAESGSAVALEDKMKPSAEKQEVAVTESTQDTPSDDYDDGVWGLLCVAIHTSFPHVLQAYVPSLAAILVLSLSVNSGNVSFSVVLV